MKKLICNANLQVYEKNSFTYSPWCLLSSFSQKGPWLLLQKRLWKCASRISFRKYKRKVIFLVIYLFNYDSSKSFFLMLNMAFDVQFLSILRLKIIKITGTSFFCSVFWFVLFYKKVIVLHHSDNNFLFWHLYQILTFNDNLNDEEMMATHSMCVITSLW